jgi:hypothetical protein
MEEAGAAPGRDADDQAVREYARLLDAGELPDPDEFLAARPALDRSARDRILHLHAGHVALRAFAFEEPDAPPAAAPPPAFARLGDFRIVRELGRGGMGVVYVAEQLSLGRLVALKVLPAHLTLRPDAVERFRREASMAARLRHPGIVEIHAVGEEAGTHWFAMELVAGTPLDRVLQGMRDEPLERSGGAPSPARSRNAIETACRLVAQVADALEHAHGSGVIHRDVKPSNILVRENGAPVLTHFGRAREEGLPALTLTGEFAGTPCYVSPEQAMERGAPVDHRTDVFSLGVTLYELLTLRRPFEGRTTREVLAKIVAKEPPNPRRFNPLLPRDLVTIVSKALEKDPARRYGSAGALAGDLRAFLAYRPIEARPAGAATRALKYVRRHRAGSGLAAAAALALAAFAIWWWRQPGVLVVSSPAPGAAVFVDGYLRGRTPLELSLEPGLHRVRLVDEGAQSETDEEEVTVQRGRARHYDRQLGSRNGVLQLESDPAGARVTLIDEQGRATAVGPPAPAMIRLLAGRWRARFELPGFDAREEDAVVRPKGELTVVRAAWPTAGLGPRACQTGIRLEVHRGDVPGAGPAVASVTLPLTGPLRLPVGTYSLRATLPGHDRSDIGGAGALRLEEGRTAQPVLWLPGVRLVFETALGENVNALTLADLDDDGLPELLLATRGVLAVSGDGSRRWTVLDAAAGPISALEASDLDGDGRAEVVIGDQQGRVQVVAPDGGRRLVTRRTGHVHDLALADLDGRGPPDLVMLAEGELLAIGLDGEERFHVKTGDELFCVAAGDLVGDRRSEIVAGGVGRGLLLVLDPTGKVLHEDDALPKVPALAFLDVDRDGRSEILYGTWEGAIVACASDGRIVRSVPASGRVRSIALGDLDGDGEPEIVAGTEGGRVLVLDRAFSTRFELDAPASPWWLAAADLDGDGRAEIVGASRHGRVLVWTIENGPRWEMSLGGPASRALLAQDLDGRPGRELVTASGGRESRVLCLGGEGAERWAQPMTGETRGLTAGDLDGDGRPEILAASSEGRLLVFGPDGTRRQEASVPEGITGLALADLEGDRRPEILTGTIRGELIALRVGGPVLFRESLGDWTTGLAAVDLDADGTPEIVAGTRDGRLVVLDRSGRRVFERTDPGGVRMLALADLDGDRRIEIVRTSAGGGTGAGPDRLAPFTVVCGRDASVAVAELDGRAPREIVTGTSGGALLAVGAEGSVRWARSLRGVVGCLRVADLDDDDRPELVAATQGGELGVFDAEGLRIFRADRRDEVRGLVVADLTGDGRPEIALTGGERVSVYAPADDPRRGLRRRFLEALDAAERGEEADAARGFEAARLRWLPLDDFGLPAIRGRLRLCRTSPSARRMAEALERVRPAAPPDWIAAVRELVAKGRGAGALALARERFASPAVDPGLADRLNEAARSLVDQDRPPEAREIALILAQAAVAASGGTGHGLFDTLAEALLANGRSEEAVAAGEKALALCPEDEPCRPSHEASLARFRTAAERASSGRRFR